MTKPISLAFHALVALTLTVAGLAQGADPEWIKLRSANFEVFTSAGERAGSQTIEILERTRSFFQQRMQLKPPDSVTVRVVLFGSEREYLPYRLSEVANAYYMGRNDADWIVLVAGDQSSRSAIHEYVHLLVRHSKWRIPRWLNEGLAVFYSTMRRVGWTAVVGEAPPERISALRTERWEPLEQVLQASYEHYTEGIEPVQMFYSESWALTHMLLLSQEFRHKVTELFRLLTADTPSATALETVYGIPIGELERRLQSYVRQGRLLTAVFDLKLGRIAGRSFAEPATGLEVVLLLADLLANLGRTEEARAMYKKASTENPEAPGPHERLGNLEYLLDDRKQAEIHFGRAFELGSESPVMLLRYARLQRVAGDENMVETLLMRAVAAAPEDVEAKLALGGHFLHRDSYAEAVAILKQIRDPNAEQARSAHRMLANAHFMLNDFEKGLREARQLLELARTPGQINEAQRLLANLERDSFVGSDMVAGLFVRLHCLGNQARMELAVGDETVSLLIDDGGRVAIKGFDDASVDLHCGEQKPRSVVVRFLPAENTELETQGVVRSVEFTEPAH